MGRHFYVQFSSNTRKNFALFEDSQASPACRSSNSSMKTEMIMEHWWNDTDGEKTEVLGQKPTQCNSVHHTSHLG
jgi:hypothetical protein